jgi:mitofilin
LATTALTGTFYVGSTFVAFNNQAYYDIFVDKVPLGQTMIVFAERKGWDTITAGDVVKVSSEAALSTYRFVWDLVHGTRPASDAIDKGAQIVRDAAAETKNTTFKVVKQTTSKVEPVVQEAKKEIVETVQKAKETVQTPAKPAAEKAEPDLLELVQRAEAAIAGKPFVNEPSPDLVIVGTTVDLVPAPTADDDKNVYDRPLPIGFEPPPGFSRPAPPPKPQPAEEKPAEPEPEVIKLPAVAPAVATASEPIITHLAGTIDNLAAFLKSDPKAAQQAGDVLETAKSDLAALVDRIETVKEEERSALEAKLDEQAKEYTLKLLELEMEAQDRLESQEEGYKHLFEQERAKFIQAYREKLNHELEVQTELINERYAHLFL